MADLTEEEERWIKSFHRLARRIPPTLGLWGGIGGIKVIVLDEHGAMQHQGLGRHPETIVFTGHEIDVPAGGGDPDSVSLDEIDRPWVDSPTSGAKNGPEKLGTTPDDTTALGQKGEPSC